MKEQISEELANKLLWSIHDAVERKNIKESWKITGYIKESALDMLKKEIKIVKDDIERHRGKWSAQWYEEKIEILIRLQEQIIVEIQEKTK